MKLLGRHDRLSSRAHTYDWPLVIIAPGSRSGVVAIEFAMILILTVCEESSSRNPGHPAAEAYGSAVITGFARAGNGAISRL